MKKFIPVLLYLFAGSACAQNELSNREFSINGFRCPSIGLEYRQDIVSLHAGYYLTALKPGVTTNFIKVGTSAWFLPVGNKENPSSFFAGLSYMYGLNNDFKNKDALAAEAGFRWMIWKGLNLRISGIVVTGSEYTPQLNPAGGISYSFFFE